jgi:uncharacterized protein (TIGR02588 family)
MKKNALEWTVFAISVAVIAVVAGLLIHAQITTGNGAPHLTVVVGRAEAAGAGYAVPLDVRNGGDTSAEDVEVTVTLQSVPPEQSDVTIPYVPYRSMRRAWVMFSRDPGTARLEARVISYRER